MIRAGNCPEDGGVQPTDGGDCGNGVCDADESGQDCPEDCAVCGDGLCTEPPENAESCPRDCLAVCPDGEPVDGNCQVDDESDCKCSTRSSPASAALMLLGLVALLRRRRR